MKNIKKFLLAILAVFTLLSVVSCKEQQAGPKVPTAAEAAKTLIINQNHQNVVADFTLPSQIVKDKVTFTITWTTSNEAVAKAGTEVDADKNITMKINRPAEGQPDVKVNLTATVANGEDKAEKKFDFTVVAQKCLTVQEFYDTPKDGTVDFRGIIVGLTEWNSGHKTTNISLRSLDNTGAAFAYKVAVETQEEYAKLKRGQQVKVSGVKDIYSGNHQIKNGVVVIEKEPEATLPEPINISEEVKAGTFVKPEVKKFDDYTKFHIANYVRVENIEVLEKSLIKNSDYKLVLGYATGQTIDMHIKYSSFNDQTEQYKAWMALNEGDTISANCVMNYRDYAHLYMTELVSDVEVVKKAETPEALLGTAITEVKNVALPKVVTAANPLNVQLYQSTNPKVTITYATTDTELVIENNATLKTTATLPATYKTVKFTATIVAKNGGTEATETLTFSLDVVNELNTWEKYYYADNKTTGITGEGVVYTFGTKTKEDKKNKVRYNSEYFIQVQSEFGGYVLNIKATKYDATNPDMINILKAEEKALKEKFAVNTSVTFANGTKDIYNGKHSVILKETDITVGTPAAKPVEAIDLTAELLAGKDLNRYLGSFVKVTNVLVGGNSLVLLDKDGNPTNTTIEYHASYDFGNVKVTSGKIYTYVSGLLDIYKGNVQITSFDKSNNDANPTDFNVAGSLVVKHNQTGTGSLVEATNEAAKFGLDATKYEVIGSKGNNTNNNIGLNKDGTTRLYKDGNTLTFKSLEGKKIASVVILGVDNDGLELNGQAVAQGFATITFETPTEALTFINNGTKTIQVGAIYVTFAA